MIDKGAFVAARVGAGLSQGDLARLAKCSQQLIGAIEAGTTQTTKFLPKIAAVLSVQPGTLDPDYVGLINDSRGVVPAAQLMGRERDFKVYASAEGGPGEIIRSAEPIDWIPRPAPVQHVKEAYGLLITGYSMVPEFEPGDTAIVNPKFPAHSDTTCIFYTEEHGEARATIKRLVRATSDKWHVRQWNPPDGSKADFSLNRKEWAICHRVLGKFSRQ